MISLSPSTDSLSLSVFFLYHAVLRPRPGHSFCELWAFQVYQWDNNPLTHFSPLLHHHNRKKPFLQPIPPTLIAFHGYRRSGERKSPKGRRGGGQGGVQKCIVGGFIHPPLAGHCFGTTNCEPPFFGRRKRHNV